MTLIRTIEFYSFAKIFLKKAERRRRRRRRRRHVIRTLCPQAKVGP